MSHWKSGLGGHLWDTPVSLDHIATTLLCPWNPSVEAPCLLQKPQGSHWVVEGPVLGQGLRASPESSLSPPQALGQALRFLQASHQIPLNQQGLKQRTRFEQ